MPDICPAVPGVRVVAVPVPRADSTVGRVLATIDAEPAAQFTIEEIAGRLRVHPIVVRQAITRLTGNGLVAGRPSRKKNGRQPVWLYQIAPDYSAHVRDVMKRGERR